MLYLESINSLTIELTGHCNAKCPQCGRFDIFGDVLPNLPITHLDIDLIKKIPIEKMSSLKAISFNGNYGEPLLHPEIDTILEKFKNLQVDISTNGSLRNNVWWGKLGNIYKNITVTFGIDGLSDTHHLYRRNTSYKKIIENASAFIKNGGKAIWQFIIFKHNEHQIEDAKNISKKLGFEKIKFRYSDRFLKGNSSMVYKNKTFTHVLEKASEQKTIHNLSGAKEGEFYTKKIFKGILKNPIECPWAKEQKIFITHTGIILPCCYMANITAGKSVYKKLFEKIIGSYDKINLKLNNFEEIIKSDVFNELLPNSLRKMPHPNCIEHCSPILSKNKIKVVEDKNLNI